ncbi:MAG: prolyl oligopeptidase family serine peptidase [Planctomycetaceae bacterium]
MKMLFSFCSLLMCSVCAVADDNQTQQTLEVQIPVKVNYLLSLPKNYDSQEKWPLMLFLHGAGERGTDLQLVKKHGPPRLIAEGKEFPMIVVSPQCAPNVWWEPIELTALLDDLESRYKIDPNRIYVTGLSMGGFGTWRLAAHTPDRFAAIAPICGGGEPNWARRISKIPTWVFHGAKDRAVPLERSQQMVDALKRAGAEPRLTIYPEAEHDSWTETYNNSEFYEWLLSHSKSSAN